MTDHDADPSIHANDPSVQVYFDNEFANDSQFPLEPGQDAVAWIEGGAVIICPHARLADLPDGFSGPPADAVPSSHQGLLAESQAFDPTLLADTTAEQPADQGPPDTAADAACDDPADTDHTDS